MTRGTMSHLQLESKTPARPDRPEITDDEAAAMARAVVNLFDKWDLKDEAARTLLGELSPSTWARWKNKNIGRVSRDQKSRLAHLMSSHKALRIIFREPERGYGWIKRPNDAFDGASALDVMLGGELTDIITIRTYLDAERGVW